MRSVPGGMIDVPFGEGTERGTVRGAVRHGCLGLGDHRHLLRRGTVSLGPAMILLLSGVFRGAWRGVERTILS